MCVVGDTPSLYLVFDLAINRVLALALFSFLLTNQDKRTYLCFSLKINVCMWPQVKGFPFCLSFIRSLAADKALVATEVMLWPKEAKGYIFLFALLHGLLSLIRNLRIRCNILKCLHSPKNRFCGGKNCCLISVRKSSVVERSANFIYRL